MNDHLIEKLQVAKMYLQDIIAYHRINDVMEPIYDRVDEEERRQALAVVLAYYRGESIEHLPLYW